MIQERSAPVFAPLGDGAILITLGDSIDRAVNRRVHACVGILEKASLPDVIEIVPAYSSLAVLYEARSTDSADLIARLKNVVGTLIPDDAATDDGPVVTIPVTYDGPDLEAVADATRLSVTEVVARHIAAEYRVYMIGFAPGFAYLGELDPALHLPRHARPRTRVPRGSVGIAGAQTAVYPHETPGGWHLVGRTELSLFDARQNHPSLLRAGDRVRFERIG